MEQTFLQLPNFQQILLDTRTSLSQKFNVVASFVLELLGFLLYIYTIFLCYLSETYKNGKNNWKITQLSGNTLEYQTKLQSKFQCRSFICSSVITLCFYIYIYTIYIQWYGLKTFSRCKLGVFVFQNYYLLKV